MAKAKSFEKGELVEIQRDVGKPWEPAAFEHSVEDMKGWHSVRFAEGSPPKVVTYDGRTFELRTTIVPSQRIRKSRAGR